MNCLLIGMRGSGGEEVFVRELAGEPPEGVAYTVAMDHHETVPGARARRLEEVAFNRLVHPRIWPLLGLKSYSIDARFSLVHVHNYPFRLRPRSAAPAVMTLGGATYYHYLRDYLGWAEGRIDALYVKAARIHRRYGIAGEFTNWEPIRRIAVFSEFARSFLVRKGVPSERVAIIPPGFSAPRVQPPAPGSNDVFTFLFVGRDPLRKGAAEVLAATRALRRKGLPLRTILVGHPSFAQLQESEGLEGHGWSERRALYETFYPRADAVLLPARAEGFGFTLVEAMSFGRPVVATRYGSFPEIVVAGETGLLVDVGGVQALEDAMRRLVEDRAGSRRMGSAGRDVFEARFTRARFRANLGAFYERAAGAP